MTVNNNNYYCQLKLSVKLQQFYTMSKHNTHAVSCCIEVATFADKQRREKTYHF